MNITQIELYHASPDSLDKVTYPWALLDGLDKLHQNENTNMVLYGHIHREFVRQAMGLKKIKKMEKLN